MTSIDLTEAVEAGGAAVGRHEYDTTSDFTPFCSTCEWSATDQFDLRGYDEHVAAEVLTAALPHLEKQIRAQIAGDIEAEAANYAEPNGINPQEDGERIGLTRAADIARGTTEGDADHG